LNVSTKGRFTYRKRDCC